MIEYPRKIGRLRAPLKIAGVIVLVPSDIWNGRGRTVDALYHRLILVPKVFPSHLATGEQCRRLPI